METQDTSKEQDEQKALKEMSDIRHANPERAVGRLSAFEREQGGATAHRVDDPTLEDEIDIPPETAKIWDEAYDWMWNNKEPESLDDFDKQESMLTNPDLKVGLTISKDGQTGIRDIQSGQQLIEALVEKYGEQPALYGFEVYEQQTAGPLPEEEPDKAEDGHDLER